MKEPKSYAMERVDGVVKCRSCGSPDSWDRYPEKDIKSETGYIYYEGWRCRVCGDGTIYERGEAPFVVPVTAG